ncbi:MAG: hypothetical protein ACLQLG_09715 [Thermoguttaceae bacterium]
MRAKFLKFAGTLAVLAAWLGCSGPAKDHADATPASLILELETYYWSSFPVSSAKTITEVRVRPGDGIGQQPKSFGKEGTPFTLMEIIDKDHVKVRIAPNLVFRDTARNTTGKEAILGRGEQLRIATRSRDGGIDYTLQISELDQVPVVNADAPEVIAAISAHASVTKDEVGSIQEIGPPGVVGRGDFGPDRVGFDPSKCPTDEDLKNIAKLNNLRRLILSGSRVTDAGMVQLKGLARLTCLDLSQTKVGDAGLDHLKGLTNLRSLTLYSTDVTDGGVKKLQTALPNCKILWSPAKP